MIEPTRKKAILDAEKEFERKELLARALAEQGFIVIGKITSPAPASSEPETLVDRDGPITSTDPRPAP